MVNHSSGIESYLTVHQSGEGFYKEKGSKFYGFAFGITDEEDIKNRQDELRKRFHDARHHCYAYQLGYDPIYSRANDDGEPNHSAGDPILGQIRSLELTNTLVVVVRYFGGTKLGVSGLIHAYKTAAHEALSNAKLAKIIITVPIVFQFPYDKTNQIMRLIEDLKVKVRNQAYSEACEIEGDIQPKYKETVIKKSQLIQNLKVSFPEE